MKETGIRIAVKAHVPDVRLDAGGLRFPAEHIKHRVTGVDADGLVPLFKQRKKKAAGAATDIKRLPL